MYIIPLDEQGKTLRIQEICLEAFPIGDKGMQGLTHPLSTVLSVGLCSN